MNCFTCEAVTDPHVCTLWTLFPHGPSRPSAIASFAEWPTELDVALSTSDGTELMSCRVVFKGAGASRVVYAKEGVPGMAFKFNDIQR